MVRSHDHLAHTHLKQGFTTYSTNVSWLCGTDARRRSQMKDTASPSAASLSPAFEAGAAGEWAAGRRCISKQPGCAVSCWEPQWAQPALQVAHTPATEAVLQCTTQQHAHCTTNYRTLTLSKQLLMHLLAPAAAQRQRPRRVGDVCGVHHQLEEEQGVQWDTGVSVCCAAGAWFTRS